MAEARYHFGPREEGGVIAGVRAGQLLLVAAGIALGLPVTLTFAGSVLGPVLGLTFLGLGSAAAFVPVKGRQLDRWLPIVARFVLRRREWVSQAPLIGHVTTSTVGPSDPPPALKGMAILDAPVDGGSVGVLHDARANTYTCVFTVEGSGQGQGFALKDDAAKAAMAAGWGHVLRALAASERQLHRVQLIYRSVPDDSDALGEYLRQRLTESRPSAMVRSYLELVQDVPAVTQSREVFIVIQISAGSAAREIRRAGGGHQGACTVAARRLQDVQRECDAVGISTVKVLTPRLLAHAIRVAFEPDARAATVQREAAGAARGVAQHEAWPQSARTGWDHYATSGAVHATFWIAEWPRRDVGPDFLIPLLLHCEARLAFAVTMQPLDPLQAQREITRAHATLDADRETKRKRGFRVDRRKEREAENVERREEEITSGEADYRFAGYLTVTARTTEELEEACAEVRGSAHSCRLALLRCDGEHDIAFTWTIPAGLGLR